MYDPMVNRHYYLLLQGDCVRIEDALPPQHSLIGGGAANNDVDDCQDLFIAAPQQALLF